MVVSEDKRFLVFSILSCFNPDKQVVVIKLDLRIQPIYQRSDSILLLGKLGLAELCEGFGWAYLLENQGFQGIVLAYKFAIKDFLLVYFLLKLVDFTFGSDRASFSFDFLNFWLFHLCFYFLKSHQWWLLDGLGLNFCLRSNDCNCLLPSGLLFQRWHLDRLETIQLLVFVGLLLTLLFQKLHLLIKDPEIDCRPLVEGVALVDMMFPVVLHNF